MENVYRIVPVHVDKTDKSLISCRCKKKMVGGGAEGDGEGNGGRYARA